MRTRHTRSSLLFTLLLLLALLVPACAPAATPEPTQAPAPTDTAVPAPTDTAVPATDTPAPTEGPVTLTDAASREVTLETLPQRLAVIGRGPYMSLHLMFMFPEGRERLVGAEKRGKTLSDFLPFIDPNVDQIPTTAASPGPEVVAGLKPDLVIMKGFQEDDMSQALATLNIPSVFTGLETPEQYVTDITNMGKLLGNPTRAEEINAFYAEKLAQITDRVGAIDEEKKPRVLVIEYSDRGGEVAVEVPAKGWMQTIQAETAGGAPVWLEGAAPTDGWTVTNIEQIAAWNPEKIFVIVWYTLDPQEVIDGFKADPQWNQLDAVKDGELYAFPADLYGWDTPEPRWILGMTWLATRLHPGMFEDLDMQQEIYDFFGTLYGLDQASVDANIMPKVKMDVR